MTTGPPPARPPTEPGVAAMVPLLVLAGFGLPVLLVLVLTGRISFSSNDAPAAQGRPSAHAPATHAPPAPRDSSACARAADAHPRSGNVLHATGGLTINGHPATGAQLDEVTTSLTVANALRANRL